MAIAAMLALSTLTLHIIFASSYGYFRDELYYLACTEHLDFGYVDHPPLSIAVLWLTRAVLGDSLVAIRIPAASALALTVFITALIARELGGGRFAMTLASLCAAIAPVYLAIGHFFSMNALEIFLWTLAAYVLVRLIRDERFSWWLCLGVVLGLGLQNKISMSWMGAGIAAGILLTPWRRTLLTPGPWVAAAIALLLFAPHVIWQVRHGFPTLEFMRNAATQKMVAVSASSFLQGQLLAMHPLTVPVWLAGLVFLFIADNGRPFRPLGYVFLVPLVLLLSSGTSRANYLSPAYPLLFAAGGVLIEAVTDSRARVWARPVLLIALLAGGIATLPLAVPVLPVERFIAYSQAMGLTPRSEERQAMGELPQHYADQFGWAELAAAVAEVYRSLPPADRERCAIFAENYGETAAIDFFGARLGLPKAIGPHNNYFLWGPRDYTGEVMIVLGGDPEDHEGDFEQLELARKVPCRYCMPYERDLPVYIGRGLKLPLPALWPRLKNFN